MGLWSRCCTCLENWVGTLRSYLAYNKVCNIIIFAHLNNIIIKCITYKRKCFGVWKQTSFPFVRYEDSLARIEIFSVDIGLLQGLSWTLKRFYPVINNGFSCCWLHMVAYLYHYITNHWATFDRLKCDPILSRYWYWTILT